MDTNKIIGYVISVMGVLIVFLSFSQLRTVLNISLPAAITENTLIIIGVGALVVGIFFIYRAGGMGKKHKEVPIYHGKEIVGYRRH